MFFISDPALQITLAPIADSRLGALKARRGVFAVCVFTHEPESHACKGADEWLSVQGSAPPIERNPVKREATAVRRWSFTY
ncbi:MAG: hypothetical protein A2Z72_05020 [Omnitrophica bacterium RBG_13_46_9]|nr:MAG: hypothetical protein A2Z72_05020 [Omnitrophica bacterium RBG_13_46_9]